MWRQQEISEIQIPSKDISRIKYPISSWKMILVRISVVKLMMKIELQRDNVA